MTCFEMAHNFKWFLFQCGSLQHATRIRIYSMKFHTLDLIFLLVLSSCSSNSVKVINFNKYFQTVSDTDSSNAENLIPTSDLSFCLRLMPRYPGPYTLIRTKRMQLLIREVTSPIGFIKFYDEKFSRMFKLCETKVPGKWTSLCFNVELKANSQTLTIFQNGKKCHYSEFAGTYDMMYYQKSRPLKE